MKEIQTGRLIINRKQTNRSERHTNKQTDKMTDGLTEYGRQTDRPIQIQRERHPNGQTHRRPNTGLPIA